MAAGDRVAGADGRSRDDDVLHRLRAGTADEHQDVERTLDLLDPELDRTRLAWVLGRMHGFWVAAQAGLGAWAAHHPADADDVSWPRRRRAAFFAADLRALGGNGTAEPPKLPAIADTDQALGRLYVLEGSTLGGTFIDRHLTSLPHLSDVGAGPSPPTAVRPARCGRPSGGRRATGSPPGATPTRWCGPRG
jgi:heme oxygenase